MFELLWKYDVIGRWTNGDIPLIFQLSTVTTGEKGLLCLDLDSLRRFVGGGVTSRSIFNVAEDLELCFCKDESYKIQHVKSHEGSDVTQDIDC